jgi:hypothetical protein
MGWRWPTSICRDDPTEARRKHLKGQKLTVKCRRRTNGWNVLVGNRATDPDQGPSAFPLDRGGAASGKDRVFQLFPKSGGSDRARTGGL